MDAEATGHPDSLSDYAGAVIWAFSEVVLVLLAGTYAVIGVTLHLVRFVRHRMVSRTA